MSIENICQQICQNKAITNYCSHLYFSLRFNLWFLLRRENEVIVFLTSSPSKLNDSHIMVLFRNMPWTLTIFWHSIQIPNFNEWCSSTAALCACIYITRCVSTQFFFLLCCCCWLVNPAFLFSLSYTNPIRGINVSVSLLTHRRVLSGSSTLPLDWSGQ
jgi:hypothetical protein